MIDWVFYQHYLLPNACARVREKFVIYVGDGISEWYEIIISPGRVVSLYLLTDRNYVLKSQQIYWSFFDINYLRRGEIFEWYRSFRERLE